MRAWVLAVGRRTRPGRLRYLLRQVARLGALLGVAAASSSRSSAILPLSPCERRQQLKEEQGAPLRARVGGGLERHPKVSQLRVGFKPAPPT